MALIAALLAALTIMLGIDLARRASARRPASLAYGLTHGCLAVAAVVTLGFAIAAGTASKAMNASMLFFSFALIGGAFVLIFRLQRQPPPLFMVYLHAASAAIAAVLLGVALVP